MPRLPAAMRTLPRVLWAPVLLMTLALSAAEPRVRVMAKQTGLRFNCGDNVEIACVVPAGQELVTRGLPNGNWVPVAPPDDVTVWIYAELVRNGRVVRDKTQIRSGPGLSYKVVGSLAQNTAVEQRGRVGDWIRIKPLSGFSLWVSQSAIAAVPDVITPDTASPAPGIPELRDLPPVLASGLIDALTNTPAEAPVATASTATVVSIVAMTPPVAFEAHVAITRLPPPPELAALQLIDSPLQGQRDRFQGALLPILADSTRAPAQRRVAGPDRTGGRVTHCYVLTPNAQLDALPYGTQVTIEGPAWRMKGESAPVVRVDTVIVHGTPGR
ncbi:MAG: SH3 domain-containing protein [bacterium]